MGDAKLKRILYISGTRADYGLMRTVLKQINDNPCLELDIVVTGMHLQRAFGLTINDIKKDGFRLHKINATYNNDNKESMTNFIGEFILLLTKKIKEINPDIILLLGDRAEMFAGAIVGVYLGIPVAHIHGGEITSTVDDYARNAITKLSCIHFAATEESADRIIKMGENPKNVYVVGAPGLDSILKAKLIDAAELSKKYNLKLENPLAIIVQHPVSLEADAAGQQIRETLSAIEKLRLQTILVYPNSDPGGREMIDVINEYKKYPFIKVYKNIQHKDFISLMRVASVMVGNSSSGIIEAASFGLPVVNIGTRQNGRQRTVNVIDVGYQKEEIISAIKTSIYDKKFKNMVKKCSNPYGDGNASDRITNILCNIDIDKELLQKRMTY